MTKDQKEDIALIKAGFKELRLGFKQLEKQFDNPDLNISQNAIDKSIFILVGMAKILAAYNKEGK